MGDIGMNSTKWNDKKNENKESMFFRITTVLNLLLLCFSLGVSYKANEVSEKLVEYQIEQSRMPNVVCLEQEVVLKNMENDEDFEKDGLIEDIYLPVYNIGVGTAQNCVIEWDIESVQEACYQAKDFFANPDIVKEFEGIDIPSFVEYEYGFELENNNLKSVWYYNDISGNIETSDLKGEKLQISYLLPVTNRENVEYMKIPEPIVLMMLELGKQENKEDLMLKYTVVYEDGVGLQYNKKYEINFRWTEKTQENLKYEIDIKEAR